VIARLWLSDYADPTSGEPDRYRVGPAAVRGFEPEGWRQAFLKDFLLEGASTLVNL